jgi:tRNA modification GTPase
LRQLEGALGFKVEGWRKQLVTALAGLEAALDFSDEGDVAVEGLEREAGIIAQAVADALRCELRDAHLGERVREGFVVVLAGPANAGKSSLLNAIARRDVAIVSSTPGTTRDAIEVRCDLDGLPVTFVDTAGLRSTADPIEREGVSRTLARARTADLVLWLDAPDVASEGPPDFGGPAVRVATKADLGDAAPAVGLMVSARTEAGLPQLLSCVAERLRGENLGEGAAFTRLRHREALDRCLAALSRVEPALTHRRVELAAEDVRLALRALGQITGAVDVEEVLDAIFAGFCIGK